MILILTVPFYPNLIDLALNASTLFVNYINVKDYIMDTKKTDAFGIWGEMGERSSVKVNIMSVKINDFPLPPIQRVTVVALLFLHLVSAGLLLLILILLLQLSNSSAYLTCL